MIYEIYTDGATTMNGFDGSRGGYAYAVYKKNNNVPLYYCSFSEQEVTNNYCELRAVERALSFITPLLKDNDSVVVYSDSAYFVNCYKQKWYSNWEDNGWITSKKTPVANKELWEKLIPYFRDFHFTFQKVKGHADNEKNNFVDKLAVKAKFGEEKNNYECLYT